MDATIKGVIKRLKYLGGTVSSSFYGCKQIYHVEIKLFLLSPDAPQEARHETDSILHHRQGCMALDR